MNRRQALGSIYVPALAWTVGCRAEPRSDALERVAGLASVQGTPAAIAADEDFWMTIQEAFTPDRSMVNLNNGGVCPSPAPVQAAMKRYLDHANTAPAYVLWKLQEPQKETVRTGLAALFDCDREEIAITRNASESLENVQQGLELARGDEVLTTNQDYPRMITTWKQRERRNGIVLKQVPIPVPCEDPLEIVRRFEAGITAKTRVIHMCHVINPHGPDPPGEARRADGAGERDPRDRRRSALVRAPRLQARGPRLRLLRHVAPQVPVRPARHRDAVRPEVEDPRAVAADAGAAGDGRRHPQVRGDRHAPGGELPRDRGRADVPRGDRAGAEGGAAPLPARPLGEAARGQDRFRLHTSLKPGFATGVANVEIDGIDAGKLSDHLWEKDRIFTVAIKHENFQGIRVSPAVYTTLAEVDRFGDAMERVAKNGLPPDTEDRGLRVGIDYLPAVAHVPAEGGTRGSSCAPSCGSRIGPRSRCTRSAARSGSSTSGRSGCRSARRGSRASPRAPRAASSRSRRCRKSAAPTGRSGASTSSTTRRACCLRSRAPRNRSPSPRSRRTRRAIASCARRSRASTLCSSSARAARSGLRDHYALDAGRIHRVAVGCDHWRRELAALPPRDEVPRILVLGPLNAPRRHLRILKAFELLVESGLQAHLHVVGAGGDAEQDFDRVVAASKVRLRVARDRSLPEAELAALVARSSVLVHLVDDVETAVTPLEAFSMGTPSSASRLPALEEGLGTLAELVLNGELDHDSELLVDAIERSIRSARDPARVRRARASCRRVHVGEERTRDRRGVESGPRQPFSPVK
jgi:hypothetical protein